jgi:hypothetical protein
MEMGADHPRPSDAVGNTNVRGGDRAGGDYGSVPTEEEVRRQGSIKQNGGSTKVLFPGRRLLAEGTLSLFKRTKVRKN